MHPDPPWKKSSTTARARRSEDTAARSEPGGARRQAASGAKPHKKGDVVGNSMLMEDKYTDAGSFTMTRKTLEKAEAEAMQMHGRNPQWRVTIQGRSFRLLRDEDYLALAEAAGYGAE